MIYLDNNATTRIDPRVLEAMMPFLMDNYANAASTHPFGLSAHEAVKKARQQVADVLHCEPYELIFTSGATEAINLAIKGIVENYQHKGSHIVTVETEHPAVLDVCHFLEARGFEITYLSVGGDGLIDLNELKMVLRTDTILVTVMAVNNETGVIQPIGKIADMAHEVGAMFMTDATQAVGKMPISVEELNVDILAFSAHKFYGPKGIGGLFVRQRSPRRIKLEALLHGGGHERGLRSGTLNVPGIVGMGRACQLAQESIFEDNQRISVLRDHLEGKLLEVEGSFVNGSRVERLYNVTNISFPGLDANVLIDHLRNVAVSNGSACSSSLFQPSHVLKAMGLSDEEAFGAIRFSLGKYNTIDEINEVVNLIKLHYQTLHQL